MGRLTEECWRNLDPWECCGQDHYCQRGCHEEGGCTNGCKVPKLYIKLAKYEDLEEQCVKDNLFGLHELCEKWKAFFEDIVELLDYRKKKEQGLLKSMPCGIGADIYIIPSETNFRLNLLHGHGELNRVYHQKVYSITFTNNGWYMEGDKEHEYGTYRLLLDRFFKETWFLTESEAEAALAKMGGK